MTTVSTSEFQLFQKLIYDKTGIHLRSCKKVLVTNRLRKRLAAHGLTSYKKYYDLLTKSAAGRDEMDRFVDALTTNETYFFRNAEHFDYLSDTILPEVMDRKEKLRSNRIRIWCAACSSGEEPYSLAILLHEREENFAPWDISIVGTDISQEMIKKAKLGIFNRYAVSKMPEEYRDRYFEYHTDTNRYHLKDIIKNRVSFSRRNLLQSFPYGKVDIIFCRNTMIYFNKDSKQRVADNLYASLNRGGYLIVGYADNFLQNQTPFQYIKPTVFKKGGSNLEKPEDHTRLL